LDALQGLKGEPHFLDGNAMQESREEALAGDGQKGCCYSQGCQLLDQKADILVFAIILTEPRVERSKKKKAICLGTSQNSKLHSSITNKR